MAEDTPSYTEAQVNQMLAEQKLNIRLDSIEVELKHLSGSMDRHTADEKGAMFEIMRGLEDGANERRRCEANIKADIELMNKEHYNIFVKKTDLKVYAFLVVTAVTMTTGAVTWIGTKNTASIDEIVHRVQEVIQQKTRPTG